MSRVRSLSCALLATLAWGQRHVLVAQGLGGSWQGKVTRDNSASTFSIGLELYGERGAINYPSLGCAGTLAFIKADATTFWYRETITSGKEKCKVDGVIQMRAHPLGDPTRWVWRWDGGGMTARGVVRGSGGRVPGPQDPCIDECRRRLDDKVKLARKLFESTGSAHYHDTKWLNETLAAARSEYDACLAICKKP